MRNAMNTAGASNVPNAAMRRLSVATLRTRPSNRKDGTQTNAATNANTTLTAAVTSVTLCHACSHRPVRACMMDANTETTPMQVKTEYTQARMIVAMSDLSPCLPNALFPTPLACAGAYYYVSLPFVLVLIVGGTAAVVYGFMMFGRVPLKLVAFLVLAALVTIFKMAQSFFIKITAEDPGRTLEEAEAPALWKLAREVAASVGTRPVDEIRITPGTDMAVYERGSASERRHDVAHRVLVFGVGLVNGFEQDAFRAVLAHEYGHFAHRDTAGGEVALRVRRDMMMFAIALYQQGQAVWWNLAFVFLRVYDFLFRRISHGAIRLQEVLAARMAAHMYGPAAFEAGLRHVITRSVEFETAVTLELQSAARANRSVSDLYALPPLPSLPGTSSRESQTPSHARPPRTIRIPVPRTVFG
jgi:Zn-dependent protease with chaperone function